MSDWLVKFAHFLNNYDLVVDKKIDDYFYHYTGLDTAEIILSGGVYANLNLGHKKMERKVSEFHEELETKLGCYFANF